MNKFAVPVFMLVLALPDLSWAAPPAGGDVPGATATATAGSTTFSSTNSRWSSCTQCSAQCNAHWKAKLDKCNKDLAWTKSHWSKKLADCKAKDKCTENQGPVVLTTLNLEDAERSLCELALERGGSIVKAAKLLGITPDALQQKITKLGLVWPRPAAEAEH
ncbi:regulatory protein, Fis family [Nannocystis exedens]|uniref:Regulatory protein, Fis family n=2 Tax=Nannocystis exedens TaxID=54 RepID=A0A1I1T236_9BACT|nr:helix-turn-helix domain-containing protein [Nannocystis exedens]PCC75694.1 Bacterial regulatory protein, Fis family [Nannocystis exedens]SFD49350.1 regulatory protein, Fis family [Nannocystis exedens]